MKILLVSAAFAAAAFTSTAASAQALPAAVVAVVDVRRIAADCNACKTAQAALQSQLSGHQAARTSLANSLQNEQKTLQAEVDALKGAEPPAALQTRLRAFQTKAQQGEQDLVRRQQQFQRNEQYVLKQILDRLAPIYTQVMQRRGANLVVDTNATLANAQTIDVTAEVLAALNTALPRIVTTAPAQPQQTTPQGR